MLNKLHGYFLKTLQKKKKKPKDKTVGMLYNQHYSKLKI